MNSELRELIERLEADVSPGFVAGLTAGFDIGYRAGHQGAIDWLSQMPAQPDAAESHPVMVAARTGIEDLDLSVRAYNLLLRGGITHIIGLIGRDRRWFQEHTMLRDEDITYLERVLRERGWPMPDTIGEPPV